MIHLTRKHFVGEVIALPSQNSHPPRAGRVWSCFCSGQGFYYLCLVNSLFPLWQYIFPERSISCIDIQDPSLKNKCSTAPFCTGWCLPRAGVEICCLYSPSVASCLDQLGKFGYSNTFFFLFHSKHFLAQDFCANTPGSASQSELLQFQGRFRDLD